MGTLRLERRVRWRGVCLVGLTTLAVSACGGSGSGSGSGSTSPSATPPAGAPTPAATGATGTSGAVAATGATPGKTGGAPSTGPTRLQFITEADRICSQATTQLNAEQTKLDAATKAEETHDTPANRAALAAAVRKEAALAMPQLNRLRALTPPPADRAGVERYYAAVAAQTGLIDQFASAVVANDLKQLAAVAVKLQAGRTTANGLARQFGFQVCGNPGS